MKKTIIFLISLALVILTITMFLINNYEVKEVRAGSGPYELHGYAWSSNIGWISFNCKNHGGCGSSNYQVTADDNGNLSGYAWSSNIGWISFQKDKIGQGCSPLDPERECKAWIDEGLLRGWARACSVFDDLEQCSGDLNPNRGGWNGWIAFNCRDFSCGVSNYGVEIGEDDHFHGYAWGSDVIGWISFNCAQGGINGENICDDNLDYKVTIDEGFLVGSPNIITFDYKDDPVYHCSLEHENEPAVKLTWDYDPACVEDDCKQAYYRFEIDGVIEEDWREGDIQDTFLSGLSYNQEYRIRLQIRDDREQESDWSGLIELGTLNHHYPMVDFEWQPTETIFPGREIDFHDKDDEKRTIIADEGKPATYSWIFQNGDPAELNNEESPSGIIFTSTGKKTVTLTVIDDSGYTCFLTKTIDVGRKPPTWIEITP